jgi:hypothetical protein
MNSFQNLKKSNFALWRSQFRETQKKKLFAATNIRHFGPNAVKLC